MTEPVDDRVLFEAWLGGARDAGGTLIERYYDSVERFFAYKTPDRADDLIQQTFLRCVEAGKTFRGDGSFRAFLFGIARLVLCEHIRARVRDKRQTPDFDTSSIMDLVPGVSTLVAQNAERRALVLALQRIPLELQILLELFYWQELSVDELAQCLDVPPGTIKSRLHRARQLLREAMEQLPVSDDERRSARTLLQAWLQSARERAPGQAGD